MKIKSKDFTALLESRAIDADVKEKMVELSRSMSACEDMIDQNKAEIKDYTRQLNLLIGEVKSDSENLNLFDSKGKLKLVNKN